MPPTEQVMDDNDSMPTNEHRPSTTQVQFDNDHHQAARAGSAALSLSEALILTLLEKGLLEEHEIDAMFEAAISAHDQQARSGHAPDLHASIAELLRRLQAHGNSVRLD